VAGVEGACSDTLAFSTPARIAGFELGCFDSSTRVNMKAATHAIAIETPRPIFASAQTAGLDVLATPSGESPAVIAGRDAASRCAKASRTRCRSADVAA
jgi:hypothetical protein